jgi:glycosyltransferase involved in cell wall biosynthesis
LQRALRQALGQEDVEVEVVVTDDGSTDGTPALAAAFDPRVRVERHERSQGPLAARNTGAATATAPWVAFLDDDDVWAPRKLRTQLDALEAAGADWAYGYGLVVDASGEVVDAYQPPAPGDLREALRTHNPLSGGSSDVIVRRELLDRLGGFDTSFKHLGDYDMWVRLARAGSALRLTEYLTAYVKHDANMSHRDLPGAELEFARFAAKHRDMRIDVERQYRWLAIGLYRDGRPRDAARVYLRTAVRYRAPVNVARAAIVLAGTTATEWALRVRAHEPIERPAWLDPMLPTT